MRKIFHIAFTDIRLMFRDKMFFFWVLILPLLFIFIFGNEGGSGDPRASLNIINRDKGDWGRYFIEKIKDNKIKLTVTEKVPQKFIRSLMIPEDFSKNLFNLKPQSLELKIMNSADSTATMKIRMKLFKAVTDTVTEIVLSKDIKSFFVKRVKFKNIVTLKSIFPKKALKKIPSGKDHTIPGILVMFIMMNTMIYGGAILLDERKKGLISRMMFSPLSVPRLWWAKILARVSLGLLQTFILLIAGFVFFKLNLGDPIAASVIILIFSLCISSLSLLFGSIFNKEEIVIGLSILASQIFAGLGGCWWPIEVVSPTVKKIGMLTPAYWAMDAFHSIIFFGKSLMDILLNIVILSLFTALFAFLSIKFFKIKE